MAIDTRNPQIEKRRATVRKIRAFLGTKEDVAPYVARLEGHTDEAYRRFQRRAYYFPAPKRTLQAYVGMLMQPEPVIQGQSERLTRYVEDLTYDGEPFNRIAARVVREVMTTGRCVLVADYPATGEARLTRAQAEARGLRAYARLYTFENIIDWRTNAVNGERYLTHLRLWEPVEVPGKDEWTRETEWRIRVLDIDPERGLYRVRVYGKREKTGPQAGAWELLEGPLYPQTETGYLSEIPVVVFGPESLDPSELPLPPLAELVDIAESHLNNSADRENAAAYVGSPTPVLTGLTDRSAPIVLGASKAIVLDQGGTAELLQLTADAISGLTTIMNEKHQHMALVGARVLSDAGSSQISTETAELERVGEHSVLAQVANTVSDGLTRILKFLGAWEGIAVDDLDVHLNRRFVPKGLDPNVLKQLMAGVQTGVIPMEVFFATLQQNDYVSGEETFESYLARLEEDEGRLSVGADGAALEDDDDAE